MTELALFSLRSEAISKIEICYFFGAIAIAVICSVLGTGLGFVAVIIVFVLAAASAICEQRKADP
ncbi:DUF4956 domain-containing protein [Octadecabacter sp. R77987]|uniref:DUF4956 domain-containing protein n=1 Tax=Octadecabacter sp. R77987 TaxID=3093874 RepID=UPI003672B257